MLAGSGRRSERPVHLLLGAVLLAIGVAAVAGPRLLRDAEASSLEQAIEGAQPAARRLSIQIIDQFAATDPADPLGEARIRTDEVAEAIPAGAADRFGPARLVVDTNRFQVDGERVVDDGAGGLAEPQPPALPTFLTFRVHPDLADHSTLVDGRDPAPTDETVGGLSVFEFAVSPETAGELGWEIGDRVLLGTDATDLVTRSIRGSLPDEFVAELVGVRELTPDTDPYWSGDPRLHRPTIADTNAGANVFAFASVAAGQLPGRPFVVDGGSPFAVELRSDLADGAITLDNVDRSLEALTALDASFADQPTLSRPGVFTALDPVLANEVAQQRSARTTLALAATGVIGVVLAALGQLLVVSFARRRAWLTVARARGATRSQVVAGATVEMGAVAAIALVVGGLTGHLAAGGPVVVPAAPLLLGVVWCGAVLTAGVVAWSEGMRPVTVSARPSAHPGLGRWARIGGLLLVVIAAASLVTFRRRGLASGGDDLDLLVVAVPVLVPLALVHVSRWVLPAVLRRVSRRGLALGPGRLVGMRRIVDAPDASRGVVTILVLALTVAALGLGVSRSVSAGAVDASWVAAGAPFRVDTRDDALAEAVAALPGAVVATSGSTRVNLGHGDESFGVQLTVIDVDAISRLTSGTAADAGYPAALAAVDADGRVPVVAAERMSGERIRVGDVFTGVGDRSDETYVVVETRPSALGRRNDWVIADRAVVAEVAGRTPGFNELAIGVDRSAESQLRELVAASGETLVVRTELLDEQRDDPLARAVRTGYLLAAAGAVVLGLLSLVAIGVVTARQRRREVAILGLLGAGPREISRAVASELVPSALSGVVAGTAIGWFVVRMFDGRYDLSAFAAGNAVAVRPALVASLVVAAVVALAAALLVGTLVRRIVTAPVGEILRIDGAA
jgi:putative ABC transport system permease protein